MTQQAMYELFQKKFDEAMDCGDKLTNTNMKLFRKLVCLIFGHKFLVPGPDNTKCLRCGIKLF